MTRRAKKLVMLGKAQNNGSKQTNKTELSRPGEVSGRNPLVSAAAFSQGKRNAMDQDIEGLNLLEGSCYGSGEASRSSFVSSSEIISWEEGSNASRQAQNEVKVQESKWESRSPSGTNKRMLLNENSNSGEFQDEEEVFRASKRLETAPVSSGAPLPELTINEDDYSEPTAQYDFAARSGKLMSDDADIVKQAEVRVAEELKGKGQAFKSAFFKEWGVMHGKTAGILSDVIQSFQNKIAEEHGREEAARTTWKFQCNKLRTQKDALREKRESVKLETAECSEELQRYACNAESLRERETVDELHQLMASLLSTAKAIRVAKDLKYKEEQELLLCVVCSSAPRSLLFLPCKHLCTCQDCFARLSKSSCPLCRSQIQTTHSVILS